MVFDVVFLVYVSGGVSAGSGSRAHTRHTPTMRTAILRRALSGQRAAVFDANILRNAAAVRAQCARHQTRGEKIVITDAIWNELVVNDRWESTLRSSFRYLATDVDAIVASWSVRAMIAGERASGDRAIDVVHYPMTAFLRQLIMDFARNTAAEPTIERLSDAIRTHGYSDKQSLGLLRKNATEGLVELALGSIDQSELRRVKTSVQRGDRGALIDLVASAFEPHKLSGALTRQGVNRDIAERLTKAPSVTAVHNLFLTHMGLEWTVTPGVKTANLARIHNDYVDVEYAVVAWACGGDYITEDHRARRRFEEVVDLVDRIWPPAAR